MIRIHLNDVRTVVPPNPSQLSVHDKNVYQKFSSSFSKIMMSRIGIDSRHIFTVRRDMQSIVVFHTELDRLMKELMDHHDLRVPLPSLPDAFTMVQMENSFKDECKYSQMSETSKFLGGQTFVNNFEGRNGSEYHKRLISCMSALEDYLQSVFVLMENIDDHVAEINFHSFAESVDSKQKWSKNNSGGLQEFLSGMGHLIGKFLQAVDLQDVLEIRKVKNPSNDSLKITEGELQCNEFTGFVEKRRPCWYPFATEGLRLHLQVHDDQGGRLCLREDDELLRRQRFKCLGCGEPLQSLFFGLDQNYLPCRYTGGLFCKRWCHSNEHRIIPHRLLLYWDCVPHRVCRQARQFLDDVWHKPLLNVDEINGLLYEGIPAFTFTKNLRHRVVSILETMLQIDMTSSINVSLEALGDINLHFVVNNEFYSLQNIVGINNGDTQRLLKVFAEKLSEINPCSLRGAGQLDETILASNVPHPVAIGVGRFIQDFSDALIESISL